MTKILISGYIGRLPTGGSSWYLLHYILGLRRLGYDVCFLEDVGDSPVEIYNPDTNMNTLDSTYGVQFLKRIMENFSMKKQWTYRDYDGTYYGLSRGEIASYCKEAELFINIGGGCWKLREDYRCCGTKIYIDLDPVFTQGKAANGDQFMVRSLAEHDILFTIAENIGQANCKIPADDNIWKKTRQPVVLDLWEPNIDSSLQFFTTIMRWKSYDSVFFNGEMYGQKDVEFLKFIELPQLIQQKIEVAIGGGLGGEPTQMLRDKGWALKDAISVIKDLETYQIYIANSRAEWTIAKNAYVRSWSGWFSDRSACYLAAAKPVLLQDTGFSEYLPTGRGLLAFHDMEDIVRGINAINHDYTAHCEEARRIAEQYFDSDKVLKDLLHQSGL